MEKTKDKRMDSEMVNGRGGGNINIGFGMKFLLVIRKWTKLQQLLWVPCPSQGPSSCLFSACVVFLLFLCRRMVGGLRGWGLGLWHQGTEM